MINTIRDIRDRRYYTIKTKEDFMNADYGSRPPTYVDSLPLAINQWTYLDEIKAMRIKTDNTTHGWVRINFGELEVGDIINVSVEVFNISGEKSKISIEAIGGGSPEISSEKNNEWEILQLKYIVRKDTTHSLYVGIWRDDVGEFMMRNIKCEVLSQRKLTHHIIESGENVNGRYIKFDDGTMIVYIPDISVIGNDTTYAQIPVPFPHTFSEIPVAFSAPKARVRVSDGGRVTSRYFSAIPIYTERSLISNLRFMYGDGSNLESNYEFIVDVIVIGRWK